MLKKIFFILNNLENKNCNFFFLNSLLRIKHKDLNRVDFLIFSGNKNILFILNIFFFLIKKKIRFYKNIFFIYEKKSIYYGQNIFTSLPKFNLSRYFFFSLYNWISNFFIILYFKKNVKFFIIKIKKK